MTDMECPREQEVTEAIATGRWPGLAGSEVAAHTASCDVCRDVVDVARAVFEDAQLARRNAPIPPAGLVWWRAQLRARREVAETVGRPITYVQVLAGSVVAGLLFTMGGLLWPWLRASASWIDSLTTATEVGRLWVPFALAVGAWLVLAPVLLLLMLSDD
jgi:predicted anti-sigma-YlaC factor YlaD